MDPKDLEFEETLADSELLLKNTARSMDEDAEFTLESILAEYGSDIRAGASKQSNRTADGNRNAGGHGRADSAGYRSPPANARTRSDISGGHVRSRHGKYARVFGCG